jgi:hypothetical protein
LDVSQHFLQKEAEFAKYSTVAVDSGTLFREEAGSAGKPGFVDGDLALAQNATLRVFERVAVRGNNVTRLAYCYTLVLNGLHWYRWEHEPRTHPEDPVHEHKGPGERRQRSTQRIALKAVLKRCCEEISLQAEAPLDNGD